MYDVDSSVLLEMHCKYLSQEDIKNIVNYISVIIISNSIHERVENPVVIPFTIILRVAIKQKHL